MPDPFNPCLSVTEPESAPPPFRGLTEWLPPRSAGRSLITAARRLPEAQALAPLIEQARLPPAQRQAVDALSRQLTQAVRLRRKQAGGVEAMLQEFSLSSREGVALMCLAEALLRIPDAATRDALIRDKIAGSDWRSHLGHSSSLFVNAAAWGLMLTGEWAAPPDASALSTVLGRFIGRSGAPVVRQVVGQAMRWMGRQFVAGETIEDAMDRARAPEARGYRHSYDMLGEAAVTYADADGHHLRYQQAIRLVGQHPGRQGRPGVSIKLSALHPRFEPAQRERLMIELLPRLQRLVKLARDHQVDINLDAEESERLELSLDLLEALCLDPALQGWDGLGFVVQAYQKRAPLVIDHLAALARQTRRRLMVRLVKGAYWDSEIKRAQIEGAADYPVYTRKVHTDVSYLACARRLLNASPEAISPQFATHNAHTVAAVYHLAGGLDAPVDRYEFQCLHGMGEALYDEVTRPLDQGGLGRPCRIYAPVGTHETLLPYLVRRLLENGANTSFVNRVSDDAIDLAPLLQDPVDAVLQTDPPGQPHEAIALPRDLYLRGADRRAGRINSAGLDLTDEHQLAELAFGLSCSARAGWLAPCLLAEPLTPGKPLQVLPVRNPADRREVVGHVMPAGVDEIEQALAHAAGAVDAWRATPVDVRAQCLERAADALQAQRLPLIGLLVREAGKTLPAAIAEVREAVDYLRYYAQQARLLAEDGGPRPLGPVVCISPWNFPLAIFIGQVAAALVVGNTVLAKPAEQTPLVAAQAVRLLRQAGVPAEALQFLPGAGDTVGAALVADPRVQGVLFTGSTAVARSIAQSLARRLGRGGRPVPLVAETGGQNAMLVDSSALPEQVVRDVLQSAFDSAGQRCSALRVLCLQDDIAEAVLSLLRGALQTLTTGVPDHLATDIGPVIDAEAREAIERHIQAMAAAGHRVERGELPDTCRHGTFVAPVLIEIERIGDLREEVFGPVLHVLRHRQPSWDALIDDINRTGHGLTFGVHSRIDSVSSGLAARVRAGNVYVNRNMVGAVVGVQPFGGQGLSGTGPKAGGPLYLHRLVSDAAESGRASPLQTRSLPGPTGERNTWTTHPRGMVLCVASSIEGAEQQWQMARSTGNRVLWLDTPAAAQWQAAHPDAASQGAGQHVAAEQAFDAHFDAVLFEGDDEGLRRVNQRVAERTGPLLPVLRTAPAGKVPPGRWEPGSWACLVREQSISVDTAAAGGNTPLMTMP